MKENQIWAVYKSMSTRMISIAILAAAIQTVRAQQPVSEQISSAPANGNDSSIKLSNVSEVLGLRIDTSEVTFLGESAIPTAPPHPGTENPNVTAAMGADYRLSIFNKNGTLKTTIHAPSRWFAIPKDLNIIWILGKYINEGMPDLERAVPYAGLYQFDFDGRQTLKMTYEQFGIVQFAGLLPNGDLAAVALREEKGSPSRQRQPFLTAINTHGQPLFDTLLPSLHEETFEIREGGMLFCLSGVNMSKQERSAMLYDAHGEMLWEYTGPMAEVPRIIGISDDGNYLALSKGRGRQGTLDIYAWKVSKHPLLHFELPSHPGTAVFLPNPRFVAYQTELQPGERRDVILDSAGNVVTTYNCDEGGIRALPGQFEFDCGHTTVKLQVRDAP